jgi:glutathione S-transferase
LFIEATRRSQGRRTEDAMNPTALILYVAPGACSRVALVALEHSGLAYEARPVALMSGQQRQPEFLALNPKGKVPLLLTPDGPLSENVAIASWLDAQAPHAGLLPPPGAVWARAQALSWLAWSASTLHPMIYRMRMTARIHPDAATHPTIKAAALAELAQQLAVAEEALADGRPWLTGADWCIADTHVCWVYGRGLDGGLDAAAFPQLAALAARHAQRPAFQRALARENT